MAWTGNGCSFDPTHYGQKKVFVFDGSLNKRLTHGPSLLRLLLQSSDLVPMADLGVRLY